MNIRSISGVLAPTLNKIRDKTANRSDADRDPQQGSGGNEEKKRHLTKDELDQVIEYVRSLPGFKENNLNIRMSDQEGITVLFIEDPNGKVIRRMPESELVSLLKQSQAKSPSTKGRILNKAM